MHHKKLYIIKLAELNWGRPEPKLRFMVEEVARNNNKKQVSMKLIATLVQTKEDQYLKYIVTLQQ